MTAMSIDMDAGNTPANTATTLGTRESCKRINENDTLDADETTIDTLTIDVTAEGIPPFHDSGTPGDTLDDTGALLAYSFALNYDETNLTVQTQDINFLIGSNPGSSPLNASQPLPDADVKGTASGGTTTSLDDAGAFTPIWLVGDTLTILTTTDGLAPQGESSTITANTADTITVAPAFSAAVEAGDTYSASDNLWIASVADTGFIPGSTEDGTGVLSRLEISSDTGAAAAAYPLTLTGDYHVDVSGSAYLPLTTNHANVAIDIACPPDSDGDGILDINDNCPLTPNPGQEDNDGDALGDMCDPDDDNDGVLDGADNCPVDANPGQEDVVHPGGGGDACDDPDGDSVFDDTDNCPDISNADQTDTDSDALGDACDPDDDNDGFADGVEVSAGSDPLDADSIPENEAVNPGSCSDGLDNDGDGLTDVDYPGCAAVPTCNGVPATIVGSEGDDLIIGTFGPDVIVALGGNDFIRGVTGDDLICAGEGNDMVLAGADIFSDVPGNDTVFGEGGNDIIWGGPGNDRLFGGPGDDRIFGSFNDDGLDGGPGIDICAGGPDSDAAFGCESTFGVP